MVGGPGPDAAHAVPNYVIPWNFAYDSGEIPVFGPERSLMNHRFTIGVEEEFQIVDPGTGELRSHVSKLVERLPGLGEQVKPEMHQSIVEIGTKICDDVGELAADMRRTRGELVRAAERVGFTLPQPARTRFQAGSIRSSRRANAIRTSSKNCSNWLALC